MAQVVSCQTFTAEAGFNPRSVPVDLWWTKWHWDKIFLEDFGYPCQAMYRTIILPVVLYGCETWSLTLRENHRLKVFENRVLRRIFGPKRDVVTGEWRGLHNKEFYALYSSLNII